MDEARRFDGFGLETVFREREDEGEDERWPDGLSLGDETILESPGFESRDETGEDEWLGELVHGAEHEAAGESAAEWLEAEWLDTSGETAADATVEAFCERVGREWASRSGGKLTPEGKRDALLADHRDTQTGASLRRRNQGKAVDDAFVARITRAWMTSREEEMRFQTEGGRGVAPLGPMAPPSARVTLIDDPLVGGTRDTVRKGKAVAGAKIAPFTLRFARALRSRHRSVGMTNYHGHGGGAFNNRGYSLDLWLAGADARGFYRHDDAVRLLRAVNAAARAVGAQWRVIYNDFAVADVVNRELRRRHVIFVGGVRRNKARQVTGLNWHGPDPLILHFHLDITPLSGVDQGEAPGEHEASPRKVCRCVNCRPQAESEWTGEGEWTGENEWSGEAQWAGEDYALEAEGEDERSRYDPPEAEQAYEAAYESHEDGEADRLFESEASGLAGAGLSPAERKAVEITSTLETGKRGGFFGLSGNFDGQGLSFGLVNWTIGTGSLQPLLRDFAREHSARWAAAFGPDAARFLSVITPRGKAAQAAQLRFAIDEMNATQVVRGRKRWSIRRPWSDHFARLAADPAFQAIQLRYVRNLLTRAAYFCRLFGLRSEMSFAFMFDAVSSHGKWWLTKKFRGVERRRELIERRRAEHGGRLSERDLLLLIADVLGETSAPRWAEKVRTRKRWFVTGEHPRARELAGLQPRPDADHTQSRPEPAREESEDLAWMSFEGDRETVQFEDEGEWSAPGEVLEWSGEWAGESPAGEWSGEEEAVYEAEDEDFADTGETYGEHEWRPSQEFESALYEAVAQAGLTHEARRSPVCGPPFPADCKEYALDYAKRIRREKTKGDVIDRTEGDRNERLALQFRGYDVNAYLATEKESHAFELPRIIEFIETRIARNGEVRVAITGSASKTGTQCFNQRLSEKRSECMMAVIKTMLSPRARARVEFDTNGEGFSKAADGEQAKDRAVLVSVSGRIPAPPIPPTPPGFAKYCIRVCSFKSEKLVDAVIDDLLGKLLPEGVPPGLARTLVDKLHKRLLDLLKVVLKKLPRAARVLTDLNALLRFLPIEVTKMTAVFQIKERNNGPNPKTITLCYKGFGGRLALGVPGDIDNALDEMLQKVPFLGSNKTLRDNLRVLIRRELDELLPRRLSKLLSKLDSDVSGPWKAFDLNRPEPIEVFRGPADMFIDVVSNVMDPGSVFLAFDGPPWNDNRVGKLKMSCGPACDGPVIQLRVDSGVGFDLLSVNKGELVSTGCVCGPEQASEAFAALE